MNLDRRAVSAPTIEVASWVSALRHEDVPARSHEVLRGVLLDSLGAGLYGFNTPWGAKLRDWALAGSGFKAGDGEARVWGSKAPLLRAADAAMVNGTATHAFELDDYHKAKLHAGAVVIPAALAVAEKIDASGSALMTAIAAGYEVMIRSSLALDPSAARLRGWHITGICGPFGAAAACASLLRLDPEKTAWALGLAGTQGAGLWAFNADGTMSKRLHAGRAAHAGVLAAELAASGFSGPTQIYEFHDGGFLSAHVEKPDPTQLTKALGTKWHLDDTAIKPYSCCGSTHAYIDCALELRRRFGGKPWNPAHKVVVGTSKVVDVQCGFDYEPGSALNAQMSLRYAVACALLDGQVLTRQFSDERMRAADAMQLAAAITLQPDPALDKLYPANFAGWVAAAGDGKQERVDVLDPTGSPAFPLGFDGIVAKFRGIVDDRPADPIIEAVRSIDRTHARALLGLLAQ
jgi:2-methylcitrate dehydratase PrpD